MSNANHKKPSGKAGQRARKLDPPISLKQAQAPGPRPARVQDQVPNRVASQVPDAQRPIAAAIATPDAFSVRATAPAKTPSIDFQTIAMAYGDYTKKSFEQTKSFVEKLAGVRSLEKAVEIQTEFAKQAYETFVTESQKIRQLYSGLARQNFEGVVAKVLPAAR